MHERVYLGARDVSVLTGVSVGTLANWRSLGEGPPYVKAGHRVLYPEDLLREWLDNSLTTPKIAA